MKNKIFNEAVKLIATIPYVSDVQRVGKYITTNIIEFSHNGNHYYVEVTQDEKLNPSGRGQYLHTRVHVIGSKFDNGIAFFQDYSDSEWATLIRDCVIKSLKDQ